MSRRSVLRSQVKAAWHQAIVEDYQSQRINSERSLQASLWSKLNAMLPVATRRMFIEPAMRVPIAQVDGSEQQQSRFPDIAICNTKEVIGIIEIKYQPRALPSWRKDLETFHWIVSNRDAIRIANVRFRGIGMDEKEYPLARDVLFVWAGVHRPWSSRLLEQVNPELRECFLEVHAETSESGNPQLS